MSEETIAKVITAERNAMTLYKVGNTLVTWEQLPIVCKLCSRSSSTRTCKRCVEGKKAN